tara:strand:- start:308 stop:1732 length:1425 start_codon:yes stop_codon:yes gene_type:complete
MEINTLPNETTSFNSTSHALVLPVIGNTGINSKHARREFQSLEPIVGAAFRSAIGQQPEGSNTKADAKLLIEKVCLEVSSDCEPDFRSVLRDSYFDRDNGGLRRFCTESLLCLTHPSNSHKKNVTSLDALGEFFAEIFITDDEKGQLKSVGQGELHLLDQEMQKALQIKDQPRASNSVPVRRYFESELIASFRKDIASLSRNSSTLLAHVDVVVRIYLFHYITEVVRHLSATVRSLPGKIEDEELRGLYYILEGERSSSSRLSVTNGWASVRDVFSDVFSHINCLEVLNHIRVSDQDALDYADIAGNETEEMLAAVKQVARDFASTASSWRKGAFSRGEDLLNGIEKADSSAAAVTELWKWINFEIKNTGRDRIWKDVGKWFEEFAYGSLLQQRGRVGYLAILPLRYLHLLVFLAVKASGQERIRLKEFWSALLQRGFRFDETTKGAVVENLESIGILETRSDSGDARYVRSPF